MVQTSNGIAAQGHTQLPGAGEIERLDFDAIDKNSNHPLRDAVDGHDKKPGSTGSWVSESSEEDYDEMDRPPTAFAKQPKPPSDTAAPEVENVQTDGKGETPDSCESSAELQRLQTTADKMSAATGTTNAYVVTANNDKQLREVLLHGLQRARDPAGHPGSMRKGKFSDLVFARKFSAFDRQNADAANSPFRGFYTLFWTGVFLFMVKIGAQNWKQHGTPLGTNVIMRGMFRREVVTLLLSDGVMCGLTGVSWLLQRLVRAGYLDWDRSGWVAQNVWQTLFVGSVVGWTLVRDWPWSHTVFFVLHGLVMLMKQHSYAFYNGHLSSVHRTRADLLAKLKQLEFVSPVQWPSATEPPASAVSTSHLANPPSAYERRLSISHQLTGCGGEGGAGATDVERIAAAIRSGEPLDMDQIHMFERIIKWEIDALGDELTGKAAAPEKAYPSNLTLANHYEYIVFPTVVYELEYPRTESINWLYVAEKTAATAGILFVMIMVSQAFICKSICS